jgi:hypothetical protein
MTTNPPMLYWHIGVTNEQIGTETDEEAKKAAESQEKST